MKTDPPWASEQKENNNIDIKVKQTFHLKKKLSLIGFMSYRFFAVEAWSIKGFSPYWIYAIQVFRRLGFVH